MGMYDTIIFEEPIICKCGQKIESTLIKEFECMMDTYHVGDMIPSAPMFVLSEESDYCSKCNRETEFYVACSYGVYLGVYESYKIAKEAIDTFDMTKLLKFYAARVSPSKGMFYQSDKGFMEKVVNFYDSPRPKKEGKWASILSMNDFKEKTPLEAIKNYLKQDELVRAIKSYGASRNSLEISYKITDEKSAYIYNQKIEEVLEREFLFNLNKIDDQKDNRPSEDNILLTFKEITQEVILDKVQQCLDDKGIKLDVCPSSSDKKVK
jgi:hypothetical protein